MCTYILQGEPELRFSLLYTMDGNDSLKRAVRQVKDADKVDGADKVTTQCEELLPGQVLTCDWFLTREEVDVFAKDHQVDVDMLTEVRMALSVTLEMFMDQSRVTRTIHVPAIGKI